MKLTAPGLINNNVKALSRPRPKFQNRERWPCPKSGMEGRDTRILGARAPSPAMSAKRETVTASRVLRLSVLRARAPALPVLTGSFRIGSTFWAKPRTIESDQKRSLEITGSVVCLIRRAPLLTRGLRPRLDTLRCFPYDHVRHRSGNRQTSRSQSF